MKLIKIFILLTILCTLIGCGQRIAGTYVKENDPQTYFEFRPDGTFYYKEIYRPYWGEGRWGPEQIIEEEGKWVFKQGTILLYKNNFLWKCLEVKGRKLFEPLSGEFWLKKK